VFGMLEAMLSFLRRQVGLRTDAADASGSLHAKVKDIKDNAIPGVSNKIGTSADNRASNTVMGWLNTQVKSWQRVTTDTIGSGVAISSVDASKCIVLVNGGTYYYDDTNETAGNVNVPVYISAFTNTSITLNYSFSRATGFTATKSSTISIIIIELY